MKIAVFGGSGFIGTRLVSRLLERHEVVILDIRESRTYPGLRVAGDVRDPRSFEPYLAGVDCIVNLAAEHKDNVRPVNLYYDVNVNGARHICEAAVQRNVNKIIFTSSVAVYGSAVDRSEKNNAPLPDSHYGRSKWAAERIFREWQSAQAGRDLLIIRPTVVFGENNRGNVYNLLRQIHAAPFLLIGAGDNVKSMAYVENVAAFIASLIGRLSGSLLYNYVDKPDLTIKKLFALAQGVLTGSRRRLIHVPLTAGLAIGYVFDFLSTVTGREFPISALRIKKLVADTRFPTSLPAETGFRPPYSLREGLEKTIKHEFIASPPRSVLFESE